MAVASSKPVILHLHLFKNAGSTVDWVLQKNFGKDAIKFDDQKNPANVYTSDDVLGVINKNPNAKSISSHQMRFPLPKSNGRALISIVFVRHPIDRAFSLYSFARRDDRQSEFNKMAKNSTLREFVNSNIENKDLNQMKNPQTRWLAQEIKEFNPPLRLAKAIENITSSTILGVVDRIDESLVVAEEILKPHFPGIDLSYVAQNVSRDRASLFEERLASGRKEIGEELWFKLTRRNELDMQVYAYANVELYKRINEIKQFEEKLVKLKQRCRALMKKK